MDRKTSLYLDLVRFTAALVVCIGHLSGQRLTGGLLWQFGDYMGQAVIVFFVLSGFVIGFATDSREKTARHFAINRAARIYSVALPALVLTFALDFVGLRLRPDLFYPAWGFNAADKPWQFLSGLLFVNRLWYLKVPQGFDLPYWSLGYEVWYYIIFGFACFGRGRVRLIATLSAMIVAGPNILLSFPLWLLGLAGYRFCSRATIPPKFAAMICGAAILLWVGYDLTFAREMGRLRVLAPAWLQTPTGNSYVVGLLFAAHVIGFRFMPDRVGHPLFRFAAPIRWIAGATFTLYLLHFPLAQFLATLVPWPPTSPFTRVAILGGTVIGVFAVAQVTERRKDAWRRAFEQLIPRRATSAFT